MPKRLLEDMKKVNITRHNEVYLERANKKSQVKHATPPAFKHIETKNSRRKPRFMLWSVAVISVVFLIFSLSYIFAKATVTVNPKFKDITLNESLSASKDMSTDDLFFDLVVISGEESKKVLASGEKEVSQKAEGTVVIYNTFSTSTQRLDIDTRLEGSNGKIYKTKKAIIVPGMTKDDKTGSVEVGIYAAGAGPEYNSAPLDFKIFGFKGTPKYAKFYARSKGEIKGGFIGKSPVISEVDKAKAVNELKATLQVKLSKKVTDQIPNGFILFKDATFLDIEDQEDISSLLAVDNTLSLKVKGSLYGFLFNEKKFTKKIAKDAIADYDDSEVFIPNIRDLKFSLPATTSFKDVKNITFSLSGSTKIVWKVDTDKLATELLGKEKKNFNKILSKYPNIISASLALSPIWKMSIPDKKKDIKVVVNYPK